ncbi:unnamed protein product [Paramecium sonneborni]|uniref:Mitochondrial import inner membrane translocase subunit TIM50 n=1 Tax=Paramecium sonneborni TaxID=65129 RepID=A0A8S1MUH2_9CILI|nr:unnamed protein product [Paramecium sonneborni]
MNSKTNLRQMISKRTPLNERVNRNHYDQEVKYTNKSFTSGKKQSANKINSIISDMLSKRQSSQDIQNPKASLIRLDTSNQNTSQRSISPTKLYQMPESLKKIYNQIHQKFSDSSIQKNFQKQKSKLLKQRTEESKFSTQCTPTSDYTEQYLINLVNQEECVFTILAVVSKQRKVVKLCQNFLNAIPQSQGDCKDIIQQKIVCKQMLLERMGIFVIMVQGLTENYDDELQHIKNLLLYIHNGMIIYLEFLIKQNLTADQKNILQNRLSKIKQNRRANKSVQDITQLKKHANVVHSLLILFIENSTDLKCARLEKLLQNIDQISLQQGTMLIKQQFDKVISEINNLRQTIDTNETEKTLEQEEIEKHLELKIPYLPKYYGYTLVIDLDETLVHYQELVDDGQFLVRPYAEQFLIEMSKYYEIVIFTAALQDYADFILDLIDKSNVISHRLYRQHTTLIDGTHVKDLTFVGRDLNTTIIIDNMAENFQHQPENGICIQSWYGEEDDRALYQLAPILSQIVIKKCKDIRNALRCLRNQMLENIENGIQDPHLHLSLN